MNANLSLSATFSDGQKPIATSLAVVAPYEAIEEGRFDLPASLGQQTCPMNFGSIDHGATALIIENGLDNQEMFLDLNDNGWTHGLAAGAVWGLVSPTLGDLPITQAALVMKTTQGGASSFSYLVLGDP